MCNHQYTNQNHSKDRTLKTKTTCHLATHYQQAQKAVLPMDAKGNCLFHSKDLPWKRSHNMEAYLNHLLDWYSQKENSKKVIDLREVQFVGQQKQSGQRTYHLLTIKNQRTAARFYLNASIFHDSVRFEEVEFSNMVEARDCQFKGNLIFEKVVFNSIDFKASVFDGAVTFKTVDFRSQCLMEQLWFKHSVLFQDVNFEHLTYFDESRFQVQDKYMHQIRFLNTSFDWTASFRETKFEGMVVFDGMELLGNVEFVETQFLLDENTVPSESSVSFKNLKISPKAVLEFKGSPDDKMFRHEVNFEYQDENIQGHISFEYANYYKIYGKARKLLNQGVEDKKVTIGRGCIEYRLQSDTKTMAVTAQNQNLITEIANTFASYFSSLHQMSLGVKIKDRNKTQIRFFYYSDENMSQEEFETCLQGTEIGFWQLLQPNETTIVQKDLTTPDKMIATVDGIAALMTTFFKVSVRMTFGKWTEQNTEQLLLATNFKQKPPVVATSLHQTIHHHYGKTTLIDLSTQQHKKIDYHQHHSGSGDNVAGDKIEPTQ